MNKQDQIICYIAAIIVFVVIMCGAVSNREVTKNTLEQVEARCEP